jgi:hypothetical protein
MVASPDLTRQPPGRTPSILTVTNRCSIFVLVTAAPATADVDDPAPRSEDARWELDALKALGDLGLRLARTTVAEAEARTEAPDAERVAELAAKTPDPAPDPALAFARISRAVRLTVMLHARLREGGLGRAPEPADAQARAELEDRRTTGRLRRAMTQFIAQTAIEALEREAPETERLLEALDERLEREGSDDADFADVEVKDLAYAIARELGADPGPDWWSQGWQISPLPDSPLPELNGGGGSRPTALSERAPNSA